MCAYAAFGSHPRAAFAGIALELVVISFAASRRILSWRILLALIVLVILFVPVKLYSLPASLPFNLEPYRLLVAFVALAWFTSLLIDPRVHLRRNGIIDPPLLALVVVMFAGIVVNHTRVSAVSQDAVKAYLFFGSYILVLFLISSVIRRRADVDLLVKVLVAGGGILGIFALIESRTGYNFFNHLHNFFPVLKETGTPLVTDRSGRLRVVASSQHPIALGAAFAMLVPFALYLVRVHRGRWWIALVLILGGAFATESRTPVLMLIAVMCVFLFVRASDVKRLWPAILPGLIVLHLALPGTLGTLKDSFFPKGGLIQQQANAHVGSGRIATLGPALRREFDPNPILGEGYGTRVTTPDRSVRRPNGPILDDQWLGLLLETGALGVAALGWLFVRFVRLAAREAKRDNSWRGWLLASTAAAVTAYAVSMFTYDAFSFIQVTFLLYISLAIGSVVYRLPAEH